jgi:CheY-like chemotaxis protein
MTIKKVSAHILLAEDDDDDSMLFKEALNEISLNANLHRVKDGEELMQNLSKSDVTLPDILFLDINMPRKNGFECLLEIKKSEKFKNIPVVILSTSSGKELVVKMYNAGANLYVCKPSQFGHLKKIIEMTISTNWSNYIPQPPFENFMINIQ